MLFVDEPTAQNEKEQSVRGNFIFFDNTRHN